MQTLLNNYLEQAEKAGLNEGDYLKICNALKKSFEEVDKKDDEFIIKDRNIRLTFQSMEIFDINLHITKFIKSIQSANQITYSLEIKKRNKIIVDIKNQTIHTHELRKKLDKLLACFAFTKFNFIDDTLKIEYDYKNIYKDEHELAKFKNSLGSYYDDDDDDDYEYGPDHPISKNNFIFNLLYEVLSN